MTHVRELRRIINEKARGQKVADQWIKKWLFVNSKNQNSAIPHDADSTLIMGLKMLFEYPYQAVCETVSKETAITVVPYVAISETTPSDILIVATDSSKIVCAFRHQAWKFRFRNLSHLESWMIRTSRQIKKGLKGRANGRAK